MRQGSAVVVATVLSLALAGGSPAQEHLLGDCESQQTASERSACLARELTAAEAAHRRAFEACEARLSGFLRDQLVAQEQAWKGELAVECGASDPRCLTAANLQRDEAMRAAFPQCGAVSRPPSAPAGHVGQAKTGMLPAQWTPASGTSRPVPFSFEAESPSHGTMSTTLGAAGEQFHGPYVRVEKSSRGHLVTAVYDGWSSPEWQMWTAEPDGGWTETGVSVGEFAAFYTGKVVATLSGGRGHSMRCQLSLNDPEGGLLGGGSGRCQVSDGGSLSLEF
jgi:hypothetical protein